MSVDTSMNPPQEVVDQVSKALKAEGILTPNVLAYALATIKAETGNFQPVREGYYLDKGKAPGTAGKQIAAKNKYGGGDNYYGRGYIQLTHLGNYKAMAKRLGIDLVNNPDLALQPDIAAKILAAFFKDRGVAEAADNGDYIGARKPINGTDRAGEIASYANSFAKQAGKAVLGAKTEPMYEWSTRMTTADGRDMVLNNRTGAYENVQDILHPSPQPAQDLRMRNSWNDKLWDSIFGKADASYDPTNPGGLRNYSSQPASPYQNYTVRPGDTLWGIAEQYGLGGQNFGRIKGYSGSPGSLPIGQQLQIPQQRTISYSRPTPPPQQNYTPANANYTSNTGVASYAPPPRQTYSVQPSQPTSQPSAQLNFSPKAVSGYSGASPNNATTKSGLKLTI